MHPLTTFKFGHDASGIRNAIVLSKLRGLLGLANVFAI
jgi:hypothetical protein